MGFDSVPLDQPWVAIPVLFGAGLLTSMTPCIYPMIPITAAILGGAGTRRRAWGARLLATFSYVLGLALVYAVLGLLAGMTGTVFGAVSASPWAYLLMANVLLAAALVMFDAVPLPVPQRLLDWAARRGGESYSALFLMGATSGLVAAPCGAPAFAAVLIWVGSTRSALWGFTYLFVFSLGMSALLVAIGMSASLAAGLPRAGKWMVWIKRLAAVVLMGMAEYYLIKVGLVS